MLKQAHSTQNIMFWNSTAIQNENQENTAQNIMLRSSIAVQNENQTRTAQNIMLRSSIKFENNYKLKKFTTSEMNWGKYKSNQPEENRSW